MELLLVSTPRDRIDLPGQVAGASVSLAGVNWSREVAVIVDMGEQRTGGYSVKVTGVDLTDSDHIELQLEVHRPAPGAFVTQVLTHPYAVARVPRVGLRSGEISVTARDQTGAIVSQQVVRL